MKFEQLEHALFARRSSSSARASCSANAAIARRSIRAARNAPARGLRAAAAARPLARPGLIDERARPQQVAAAVVL